MISYLLDILLCSLVVLAKVVGIMSTAMLVQLIFYRVFNINLYKTFLRFSDELDKKINEIF